MMYYFRVLGHVHWRLKDLSGKEDIGFYSGSVGKGFSVDSGEVGGGIRNRGTRNRGECNKADGDMFINAVLARITEI